MSFKKNPDTLWRVQRDADNGKKQYIAHLNRERSQWSTRKKADDYMGKIILGVSTAWQMTGSSSDQMREAVSDHYKEHESEYYELAVMQAYTEGVQLSLQEPLVIGDTSSQLSIDFQEN